MKPDTETILAELIASYLNEARLRSTLAVATEDGHTDLKWAAASIADFLAQELAPHVAIVERGKAAA